jgi:putative oxidoreductase
VSHSGGLSGLSGMNTTPANAAGTAARRDKVVYWITTGIIVTLMLSSALNFAFNPGQRAAFHHLGLPDWFRIELTTAKLLGVLALVVPGTPRLARQFAYFGFGLTIVSADVAHLSSGDPWWFVLPHAFFLATLVVSFVLWRKLDDAAHAGAPARRSDARAGSPSTHSLDARQRAGA